MVWTIMLWTITEAEDIKKRWQQYTEEQYKKDHDAYNHDGTKPTFPKPSRLTKKVGLKPEPAPLELRVLADRKSVV